MDDAATVSERTDLSARKGERPVVVLVPGDPTGIGPEQDGQAPGRRGPCARWRGFLVVGDARVLRMGAEQAGVDVPFVPVAAPGDARWDQAAVPVLDLANLDPAGFAIGAPDPAVGRVVGETLSAAIDLAKAGFVDAICFAPLNKQALHAGGWRFSRRAPALRASSRAHRAFQRDETCSIGGGWGG